MGKYAEYELDVPYDPQEKTLHLIVRLYFPRGTIIEWDNDSAWRLVRESRHRAFGYCFGYYKLVKVGEEHIEVRLGSNPSQAPKALIMAHAKAIREFVTGAMRAYGFRPKISQYELSPGRNVLYGRHVKREDRTQSLSIGG